MFYIFLIFAVSFFESAQGHYFFAEKWTHPDLPEKRIYCLADYHISSKEANKVRSKQQEDAIELHKRLKAVAIVEDSCVWHKNAFEKPLEFFPSNYYMPRSWLQENIQDGTPLFGLASFMSEEKIHRTNIDFRIIKALSLHSKTYPDKYQPISAKITFEYLQQQVIEAIKGFDDGAICNSFYAKQIEHVEETINGKHKEFFDLFRNNEKSFDELLSDPNFCKQALTAMINSNLHWRLDSAFFDHPEKVQELYAEPRKDIELVLLMFDLCLVDCLTLNILTHYYQKAPVIIIHAGGEHINSIRPALKEMGYISTPLAGTEHIPYFEGQIPINKHYSQEPDAIDLKAAFAAELSEAADHT